MICEDHTSDSEDEMLRLRNAFKLKDFDG